MARLLRDRYFPYDSQHAWDLATGESVPVDDGADQDECDDPPLPLLIEVLEHGREGTPRSDRRGRESAQSSRRGSCVGRPPTAGRTASCRLPSTSMRDFATP